MKVSEQIDGLQAQVEALTKDVERLTADAQAYKDQLQAAQADATIRAEADAAALAAAGEALAAAQTAMNDLNAKLATETARADAAEAKLTLVPAAGDVTAGEKPVADGGDAANAVTDWVAAVESKSGGERIAFYRQHREQIDRAYAQRGR
jgi:uncharacterized protein YoxC